MAKGKAGRTYTRDSRGRFASTAGGGKAAGAKKPAAKARPAAKATGRQTAAKGKPAARRAAPPPPPWSPAMKKAAAERGKAKQAAAARPAAGKAANKIAPSPRVPGTRDSRLTLPKSLTKKGWDYSQYMNRDDAESDRRYFARQWTAAAKKEIQLRNEIASLKKTKGSAESKIAAAKKKIEAPGGAGVKEAKRRFDAASYASKQSEKRLRAANEKAASASASLAKLKADFKQRFGMTYEESIARRKSTRKRKP